MKEKNLGGYYMEEKSIGRGVIILSISSIILKLLSALYMPVLSYILTDEGIAIYTVGYDVFVFLFALTSLGVQPAITKVVAEYRVKESGKSDLHVLKVSRNILCIYGGIVSLLFAVLAKPLAILLNSEQSVWVFVFLSPAVLIASILTAYRGYFQGCNDMISLSVSNIIEQLLNVVFSLIFALQLMQFSIRWGSTGGTVGTTVGAVGAIIYIKYIMNKKYINKADFNKQAITKAKKNEILKTLFTYAVPFILIAAIQNVSNVIDVITIRNLIENDVNIKTATLKYYTTIINVPLVIVTSLGIGIFPKIIKGYIEKNKRELMIQTSYFYKLTYIITIPAVCGLMILSKEIFHFVFGRIFGYEVLLMGAVALLFMALTTIQNIVLQGMNEFKFIINLGIITTIIKTLINVILIRIDRINIMGAVIATIVSLMIATVVNHRKLQKAFDVKIPIVKQSKTSIISAVIMSVVLLGLKYVIVSRFFVGNYTRISAGIVIFILIIVGAAVYFAVLLLIGGITKYELDTVSPKIYELMPQRLKDKIVKVN